MVFKVKGKNFINKEYFILVEKKGRDLRRLVIFNIKNYNVIDIEGMVLFLF